MSDAQEPLVGVGDEESQSEQSKCAAAPIDAPTSCEEPVKPKRCCKYTYQRRDACFTCVGFLLSLLMCGGALLIFLKISSDNTSTASLNPLVRPEITALQAGHPGWLTLSWTGPNGSQWDVKRTTNGSSESLIEAVLAGHEMTDSDLNASTPYCYMVRAVTVSQNSSWSDPWCENTTEVAAPGQSDAPVSIAHPTEEDPALVVQALLPRQIDGNDDYGGDQNLTFFCKAVQCQNFLSSSCQSPQVMEADSNRSCSIPNAVKSSTITVWSYSTNSGGQSNLTNPLFCVNSTGLIPNTSPTLLSSWSCSRSAPPVAPVLKTPTATASSYSLSWTASKPDSSSVITSYDIQADDWWNNKVGQFSIVKTVSGQTLTATIGGDSILPATTYHVLVVGHSSSGDTAASAVQSVTTANKGACGNPTDLAAQRDNFGTMKDKIQLALISCLFNPNKRQCATDKVAQAMGWSSDCASCWADEGFCVLKNCGMCKFSPKSAACDTCAKKECFPTLEQCSGLPEWSYPP